MSYQQLQLSEGSALPTREEELSPLGMDGDASTSFSNRVINMEFRVFSGIADPSHSDPHTKMAQATSKKDKPTSSGPQISLFQFFLASILFQFLLSYVITETWTWGYQSKWMQAQNWKYLLVSLIPLGFPLTQTRPLSLTEAELAQYDGTDPSKPIYLAIE
jgi:hypothetical protein